ncbi:FRG domain [Bartonella choladocola]|uniref:FRG domain-containing protein n=1 Tax=Bartonella TaxID=773 RepID=UPI0018DB6AEF|nr:FRG domain-containing protein [Bartonella choladocola]MBI0141343.1 FRG domain-containing protein [Bartonella choladocola]
MAGNERRHRRDIEVESVSDFISYVLKQENKNGFFCYRGQACEAWRPEPSLHRQRKNADVERQSLTELVNEIPDDFQKDVTCFQRLMHSQHYGLPTRLLDVTMNPLVALFFACSDEEQKDQDGAVYVFDFEEDRILNPDSDTLSIICNLSGLSDYEKRELEDLSYRYLVNKNENEYKKYFLEFNENRYCKKLVNLIRNEKIYFEKKIDPSCLLKYYFVSSLKSNNRIIAQSGAFIVSGFLKYHFDRDTAAFEMEKIIIPSDCKNRIIDELSKLNITGMSMFPDIDHIAAYLKHKYQKKK